MIRRWTDRRSPADTALVVGLAVVGFVLMEFLLGPIFWPVLAILVTLAVLPAVTAKGDLADGAPRLRAFVWLAFVAIASIVALDVLVLAVVFLGGALGLWPAMGSR